MKKILTVLILVAVSAALFAGGGSAQQPGAQTAAPAAPAHRELTLYTPLSDTEIPTYFNAFERETGIKINYVRLAAGEMLARVAAEKANPQAALMFGGASDTYIAAHKDGLLEPYQSSERANVPEQYRDAQGVWNPIYVGAICFAINKDWFAEKKIPYPKTWEDLTKPEFKGQVSMAHPSSSGTSYTVLATILQLFPDRDKAWDYLKRLNANVRQYTRSGTAPPREVALGEAAIAITFSHDGLRPADEGYPIEIIFPSEGTGFEVGAMGLIKGGFAREQENARRFIDWFMSVKGQELYIESKSNRLPINIKAKVTPGLTSLDKIAIVKYDAVWAGNNKNDFIKEFNEKVDNAANLKQ